MHICFNLLKFSTIRYAKYQIRFILPQSLHVFRSRFTIEIVNQEREESVNNVALPFARLYFLNRTHIDDAMLTFIKEKYTSIF